MKVTCPKCGFQGNIKDELIPDDGKFLKCPKCKYDFYWMKPIDEETLKDMDTVYQISIQSWSENKGRELTKIEKDDLWKQIKQQRELEDEIMIMGDSGNLPYMLFALNFLKKPVNRHFLFMKIVEHTYKERNTSTKMRELCEKYAWEHIQEFPNFKNGLIKEFETLPIVTTFQRLSTILTEDVNYDKAIAVCKKALSYGLIDGTKGGYEGRIERIKKKREKEKGK